MSDRLEYPGNPLPSGLPGFGGGTVDVVVLPGFNRVVAAQKFGPVNYAPTVTVPSSTPPVGSNPADPTTTVVTPATAPVVPGTSSNFLKKIPPCEDIDGLFGAFAACDRKFQPFTICEDGEPKVARIFVELPSGFG